MNQIIERIEEVNHLLTQAQHEAAKEESDEAYQMLYNAADEAQACLSQAIAALSATPAAAATPGAGEAAIRAALQHLKKGVDAAENIGEWKGTANALLLGIEAAEETLRDALDATATPAAAATPVAGVTFPILKLRYVHADKQYIESVLDELANAEEWSAEELDNNVRTLRTYLHETWPLLEVRPATVTPAAPVAAVGAGEAHQAARLIKELVAVEASSQFKPVLALAAGLAFASSDLDEADRPYCSYRLSEEGAKLMASLRAALPSPTVPAVAAGAGGAEWVSLLGDAPELPALGSRILAEANDGSMDVLHIRSDPAWPLWEIHIPPTTFEGDETRQVNAHDYVRYRYLPPHPATPVPGAAEATGDMKQ